MQARGLGAADVVSAKSDTTVLLSRGGTCKLKMKVAYKSGVVSAHLGDKNSQIVC